MISESSKVIARVVTQYCDQLETLNRESSAFAPYATRIRNHDINSAVAGSLRNPVRRSLYR